MALSSTSHRFDLDIPSDQQKMYEYAANMAQLLSSDLPEDDVTNQIGQPCGEKKYPSYCCKTLSQSIQRNTLDIVRKAISQCSPVHVPAILRSASIEFGAAFRPGGDQTPQIKTHFWIWWAGSKPVGPNRQFFPVLLVCPYSFDRYNQILTLCCSYRRFEAACCVGSQVYLSAVVLRLSKLAKCTHGINKLVRVWDHPWRKYHNLCCRLDVPLPSHHHLKGACGGKKSEGASMCRKLSWDPLFILHVICILASISYQFCQTVKAPRWVTRRP